MARDERQHAELDPVDFLRRMLAISPEDAAEVRKDAANRPASEERSEDESESDER